MFLRVQFQYISCCSLSVNCVRIAFCNDVSIHLMLQFILERVGFNSYKAVSIHLMLQFINLLTATQKNLQGFNTSHVVVYHNQICGLSLSCQFQYISCCSLSSFCNVCFRIVLWFQYISCCSLSVGSKVEEIFLPAFQYISCCSLSCRKCPLTDQHSSFNTSHVVVYPSVEHLCLSVFLRFNTSHVVVYPGRSSFRQVSTRVSIHLMLQFIKNCAALHNRTFKFQYISCCSLSWLSLITMFCWIMFQYISCCSLSLMEWKSCLTSTVSIHLMLQFI